MQVITFTGCTEQVAKETLEKCEGDVLEAIILLSNSPEVSGNKYIPDTPKINDGLTDEQRENIRNARKLADMFTSSPRNDLRGTPQKPVA